MRPATPDDAWSIARVHVAAWRDTYAGLLPAGLLAGLRAEDREPRWRAVLRGDADPQEVAVWEAGGLVAGFACVGPSRDDRLLGQELDGEVRAIYVLRAAQGAGGGRALLSWAASTLQARGHRGMGLWVLAGNRPARAFYERMGGRLVVGETPCEVAGVPTTEVAYGWPAPAALISASATTSAARANIGVGSSQ